MRSYAVLTRTSQDGRRTEKVQARTIDVNQGVLVFYGAQTGEVIAAFKEWIRVDRLL